MFFTPDTSSGLKNGINTEPIPVDKQSSLRYLESYTYSCKDGYTTNDTLYTLCYPNGTLSAPPPTCSGKVGTSSSR